MPRRLYAAQFHVIRSNPTCPQNRASHHVRESSSHTTKNLESAFDSAGQPYEDSSAFVSVDGASKVDGAVPVDDFPHGFADTDNSNGFVPFVPPAPLATTFSLLPAAQSCDKRKIAQVDTTLAIVPKRSRVTTLCLAAPSVMTIPTPQSEEAEYAKV